MTEQFEIKKGSLKAWILAARPKTLSGAAVPVMIGTALAYADLRQSENTEFSVVAAVLCFLFAFIMQIDANLVNDLFDYLKGSDDRETRLGPPRACAEGWIEASSMKTAVALVTTLACFIGLPLVLFGGIEMILIGIICVAFCFLYTTTLAGRGLGDVLVLVFFGMVPVCTTYYIQTHTCTPTVFIASVACGLVVDGLLVVNNFRDRETDRSVGKKTLVVKIGEGNSLNFYLALGIVAYLLGLTFLFVNHWPATVLPTVYLGLHILTYQEMKRIYSGKELNVSLGHTARNMFVYGLTVATGLLINF